MEIKRFGDPAGKTIMLLHGNLMCWRQFEDVIPLLEKTYRVYAVSFDGFDGTATTPRRSRRTSWKPTFLNTAAGRSTYCSPNPLAAGRPFFCRHPRRSRSGT